MREMIQQVLAAEAEGKRVVATARSEAERIVSEARKAVEERLARAQLEARTEAAALVKSAVQHAEQERAELLAQSGRQLKGEVELQEPLRRALEDAVLRCVCDNS